MTVRPGARPLIRPPAVPATDGQVYGYDAALDATRAFDLTSVQTWSAVADSGVVVDSVAGVTATIATLVLPDTVDVPVMVGGIASIKATTAAATIYFGIGETDNGVDDPVSATWFRGSMALNAVEPFILPDFMCRVAPTGRTRTLTLVMYSASGTLQALNGFAGLPTVMSARSSS